MPQPYAGPSVHTASAVSCRLCRFPVIPLLAVALSACAAPSYRASAPPEEDQAYLAVSFMPDAAFSQQDSGDGLGARVVDFARRQIGRIVGTGQCAELADQALMASGARSFGDFADRTQGDDYVWGRRVSLSDARPGDIVQFRDYSADIAIQTPNGEDDTGDTYPHHTAILEARRGDWLIILQQNDAPDLSVRRAAIPSRSAVYPGFANGLPDPSATTIVRVRGIISIYRPEPV